MKSQNYSEPGLHHFGLQAQYETIQMFKSNRTAKPGILQHALQALISRMAKPEMVSHNGRKSVQSAKA